MADAIQLYCGTWKIVECVSLSGVVEITGIEGTEFRLDESGDVIWKIPENTEHMPIFYCETFEVYPGTPPTLKFFGSYAGHVIEFRVEISDDLLILTYDGWCMLQCQRIAGVCSKCDAPFSLLGPLEEGYFSDIIVTAANGREFRLHKTILKLGNQSLNWDQQTPPLSGLPEDVVYTLAHFLYTECLPTNLTSPTAKQCITAAKELPGFNRLVEMCEMFVKNAALKQQIVALVTDMHNCASRIIDYFNGKRIVAEASGKAEAAAEEMSSADNGRPGAETLISNPPKLCYVVKQALREAAVAGAKLLILCDIFSRKKHELSRDERHDIMKYAKSRLPIFMSQLQSFLEVVKSTFSNLSPAKRQDIATYLVPEIESALDTISHFVVEMKTALEQIINSSNTSEKTPSGERGSWKPMGEMLGKSFRKALHLRELMKFRTFHEKITISFMNLVQKKENFHEMTTVHKIRSISRNLEQIIEEIPLFLLRLEEVMTALDEKLNWREWKYMFKLGTSKVAWVLYKLLSHKTTLRGLLLQLVQLVQRDQFTQALQTLGLLDLPLQSAATGEPSSAAAATTPSANVYRIIPGKIPWESLTVPPMAKDSTLAQNTLALLKSGVGTDMVFEIVSIQDMSDTVIDHTQGVAVSQSTQEQEVEMTTVSAHCVIIAARCDWFRRALLSGMKESIDKKIVVHDTNPALFTIFLEYLYGGYIDVRTMSTDVLSELLQLADRYEVDMLKQLCESCLLNHVDDDTVVYLLSLADQFNAKFLRNASIEYIAVNPEIMESEVFDELPEDLQCEVEDMAAWVQPGRLRHSQAAVRHTGPPASSPSSSLDELEEMATHLKLGGREKKENSNCSSLEELPLTQDSAQLEACMVQLRDIIGDSVTSEQLTQIALAADYDVNRALNFFFSGS